MKRRNAEASLLAFAVVLAFGAMLQSAFARGTLSQSARLVPHTLFIAGICLVTHLVTRRLAPNADPVILPCAITLAGIGFAMVDRLDHRLAGPQMLWLVIGAAAFCITLLVLRNHRQLESFRYSMMLLGVGLLLVPMLPVIGRKIHGAQLWIRIGPATFQPVEIAKVALAIFLAAYLASKREVMTVRTARLGPIHIPAPRHFGPLVVAWGISVLIIIFQSDLGMAMLLLGLFIATIYAATSRAVYVVAGGGLFAAALFAANSLLPHVHRRLSGWVNPWKDVQGAGFQIAQSLFALGNGGLGGTGIGRGRPDLIHSAVSTDFIFAAIGEELGLAGTTAILLLFAIMVSRGFHIALRSQEPFGQLLAVALTTIIGLQTFLIVGGVSRLIPLTGITLPFVSYGGSSIVSNFVLIAILLRISNAEAGAAPVATQEAAVSPSV
ncbi:MAG: cell shape-determining peptidoglycan glycosyltransferase RodA [Actinomycetota bacterium]